MEKISVPKELRITVTQQHIDDGKRLVIWRQDEVSKCPLALAITEAVFGSYGRRTGLYNPTGKKGYGNTKVSVADDIYINRLMPWNIHILHSEESKKFVIDFDNGLDVQPDTFVLRRNN